MDISVIAATNPWWRDVSAIDRDKHIKRVESSKVMYEPLKDIVFRPGIYTLRGMRQIGKTTTMKMLIRRLLKEYGVSGGCVTYISVELIDDYKQLYELVKLVIDYMRTKDCQSVYLFLDEVSFVPQWQRAIKFLWDTGDMENVFLMLSGSSAYDIVRGKERLPGRRGSGKDYVLLPLYPRLLSHAIGQGTVDSIGIEDILHMDEQELNMLAMDLAHLKGVWNMFVEIGGIPMIVDAFLKGENVDGYTDVLWDIVIGDIERFDKDRVSAKNILSVLCKVLGQRFSYNKKAPDSGVSAPTFKSYIHLLAMNYIVGVLYFYDINMKRPKESKQKKVYFHDVFLIRTVCSKTLSHYFSEGALYENAIYQSMVHLFDVTEGLLHVSGPYYWYSDKGKEVDFLAADIPIEVKYQTSITPSDYITIKRVWGRGIVITKDTIFRDGDIVGIPAWLFSLVI